MTTLNHFQIIIIAPLGLCVGASKIRVRPSVRPENHEVLSRSKSTGILRCFRGIKRNDRVFVTIFWDPDFHRFRGKGMIFGVPQKDPF